MSHALIWSEISTSNLETETTKELPFAGFGTNVANSWNKRVFRLKWLNTSVSDVKIWIDNCFADIYTNTEFPVIKNIDNLHLLDDLGFDIRITTLGTLNLEYLPVAKVATNLNLGSSSLAGTSYLLAPSYIDGTKINNESLILLKSQTSKSENGLYKIVTGQTGSGYTFYNGPEILTAGKIVSIGNSSWYSYLEGYTPGQFATIGATDTLWVDRSTTYRLQNVNTATTENLQTSGAGLSVSTNLLDNVTLSLNTRVLVKDQSNPIENGIYYVSSLYAANANTIVNPNTSTSALDEYWKLALYNISQNNPVSVQVLNGSTYGGKFYRHYLTTDSEVKSFAIIPDGISGFGATINYSWTDATHYYNSITADWYYEIGAGSSIGFSFDNSGNSGTFTSTPSNITNFSGTSVTTTVSQTILVKHYNPAYSGVYTVQSIGTGLTSVWVRNTSFDALAEIVPTIVKTTNSKSSLSSQYFYLDKTTSYLSNFILNSDSVSVSERYIPYTYEPVKNLVTSEISNFNRVVINKFSNSGIAISQRVLVAGQATTESQNGIYIVNNASTASTVGIKFYSTYQIQNGAIANSTGTGTTYFLFSSVDNASAGTTDVNFVNITSAPTITSNLTTVVDKFENNNYIYPDDFIGSIGSTGVVFVNTSNKLVNGLYTGTLGIGQKAAFNYAGSLQTWVADIYRNITSANTDTYTVTPNLRNEISGIYLSRYSGGFGDSTYATRNYGNIYVPEIDFPNTENPNAYFTEDYKGSALLQELDINWYAQDYQSYVVKAVYKSNTIAGLPISSGTAISSRISDGTLISEYDDVLFYIGTGSSTGSSWNGIYRAVRSSLGSSVYFTKHEDFDLSTAYQSNKNVKSAGTPYERPTKVIIQNGYFNGGSSFGYTSVYMKGIVGYQGSSSAFGITSITPYDDDQYNAGQEKFIRNSEIYLSVDYNSLHNFAKLSPIQHVVIGDLKNQDQVDGDILILNRGYELYSTLGVSLIKYYYEVGDRVIYKDSNEDLYNSTLTNSVNGIYVITYVNSNTWTYYLRKVKQNASIGHLDYPRRLDIHPDFNIVDGGFPLVKSGGSGSTYRWSEDNYFVYDVYVLDQDGNRTSLEHMVDYDMYPDQGYIASYSSFGSSTDTLYVYLQANDSVPKITEYPKPLYNRYHAVDQVLADKYSANSGNAKTSGTFTADASYFQITNLVGAATTTQFKNNTDRKLWYKQYNSSYNYSSDVKHIVSIGNTTDYFYTKRLSQDGYYFKAGTAQTALYFDTNILEPGTGRSAGLFYGKVYLDKVQYSGSGFTLSTWYDSLSLSSGDNVLVISNNEIGIATTLQSAYYSDKNELILHDKAGKRDQKIYEFSEVGFKPISLAYHINFTNPLSPLNVSDGVNTSFLHYDPNNNDRALNNKTWYSYGLATVYDCDGTSSANISDFNDFGGLINNYNVTSGDLIIVKDQTNKKQNGIYVGVTNNIYALERTSDLKNNSDIRSLGRVSYGNRTYELLLPSGSYSIGTTSGNTALAWKLVGTGLSIDANVATTTNYSGTALTTAFPDTVDTYTLSANEKVLLLSQTDPNQKYVGRFSQNYLPILTRVASGGSGNTDRFSITNCYVTDTNRNKDYELYFNPNYTGLGVSKINWFERNVISNYPNADLKTTSNISLSSTPSITNQFSGALVLVKDQSTAMQNGLYYIDNIQNYYLSRHEYLDNSNELSISKRAYVNSGVANTGYYALTFDESVSPGLGVSSLYWVEVAENFELTNCKYATTTAINLSSLPTEIDGSILEFKDRILVKDQSIKTENGIYIVEDVKNKVWSRASDLNSNSQIKPQLTVKIDDGDSNSGLAYRIKLPIPRTITNTQATEYILGTDNIEWVAVNSAGLFNSDPELWQKLSSDSNASYYLGGAKLNNNSVSYGNKFAIAVKTPTSGSLASIGITENGKVRNIKFKVEYKTIED